MKNIFKPILFSTPMVQAILQGKKTQTRRIIKPQPEITEKGWKWEGYRPKAKYNTGAITCFGRDVSPTDEDGLRLQSKIQIGDILWVRETSFFHILAKEYEYKADEKPYMKLFSGWKPSIHMPKEAARIFLYVTNVRVERLQDISEADAIAEGIEKQKTNYGDYLFKHYLKDKFGPSAKHSFQTLWQKIYGIESWDKNPYVWVYEYERIEKPKDFI